MNTGVKLCSAISAVGRPACAPAVELGLDPVVVGPENLAHAARPCRASPRPTLPGIAVRSLSSAIEVSEPGVRLQSITRRE